MNRHISLEDKMKRILRTVIIAAAVMMAFPVMAMAASGLSGTLTYKNTSTEVTGTWVKKNSRYYFKTNDVSTVKGWLKIGKSKYYLKGRGYRVTGVAKIRGKYYYFKSNGKQKTGLITIGGYTYYFDPDDGGARSGAGTKVIKGGTYSFNEEGRAIKKGYDSAGNWYDAKGYQIQKATLKKLLQTAMKPVGSTMYVWGGGWNTKESNGIIESTTIGVQSRWKKFFNKQSSSYNYRTTRYQMHDGLDCSGYVAWVLYNTFNTESGHGSFLMGAESMARTYANWGLGKYTGARAFTDWRAGDIMSLSAGHVYIVIGKCSDGSVVLVHSSPKGVMLTGTATPGGRTNSRALALAKNYMKKYFPAWYAKYPDLSRGTSYLTRYSRMRWYIGRKKSVMSDPDNLRNKNAAKVLKAVFNE